MKNAAKKSLFGKIVEKKLRGYEQKFNHPADHLPERVSGVKSVAIVGGGLAGISAAVYLAERNFKVDIYEGNSYLGGKLGSWRYRFADGFETNVEHGFHAFFHQYYNLRRLLQKVGAADNLIPIDDYLIMTLKYGKYSFKNISRTPILNLLSLKKTGMYNIRDILTNLHFSRMLDFLKYQQRRTFEKFDTVTFQDFAELSGLPPQMQLMFTTFSRAFFAEPQLISLAELIKSFHFYFMSNDGGLLYDVLNDDFDLTLWTPVRSFLSRYQVKLFMNREIDRLDPVGEKYRIGECQYDYVILAADIPGAKKIITRSEFFQKHYLPFVESIQRQKVSQRYAVLRIWTDKDIDPALPFFIFTDALKVLDSITTYHRMEKGAAAWVKQHGGGIFELHSYAVPDNLTDPVEVRRSLLEEFQVYFPELRGCRIKYEYFQLKNDFTAFHTNLFNTRSAYFTPLPNLFLAGDWIKIPTPAMLMEAATTSALFAVNEILKKENLQQETIYTVPLKGLLA